MPVELVPCSLDSKLLLPGDTGFIATCKGKYQKHLNVQAVKFLERFTLRYFEEKCSGDKTCDPQEEKMEAENGEEEKEEQQVVNGEVVFGEDGKGQALRHTDIKFVAREIVYDTCTFVASNLADPTDYLHFVFTILFDAEKKEKKPRFPMKFMPVQMSCEARKRQAEQSTLAVLEKWIGKDGYPHRFSIACKGTTDGNWMKQREAASLVRNCIWSVNPNCVQCIKYQDFAVMVDILDPIFCVGVASDYYTLGSYNSSAKPYKVDKETDSEDDISDDPNLDEEENKRRILRIKRKRRAEKAGLAQNEEEAKKCLEGEDEEQEEEEEGDGEDQAEDEKGE